MKKKYRAKTKEQQLRDDWLTYNRSVKGTRISKMSFEEYSDWVYGHRRGRKGCKRKRPEQEPVVARPVWAASTDHIPSVIGTGKVSLSRKSMVDRAIQGHEGQDVADEILRKSMRIGLLSSKGAYGYISDETDPKTLGKKTQQL
jgi:hypothetical protein